MVKSASVQLQLYLVLHSFRNKSITIGLRRPHALAGRSVASTKLSDVQHYELFFTGRWSRNPSVFQR